jgi:single-strand DNA-binding protein
MSFNKIILVGNLGRDPELRYTPQGTPVCDFSVATTERRKDASGESTDVTLWFKVTFWGRQAETASQYLVKGRQVYIEGRLRTSEWTDREGKNRTTLEVHGTEMHFIGSANADSLGAGTASRAMAGGSGTASTSPSRDVDDFGGTDDAPISDDEIPF